MLNNEEMYVLGVMADQASRNWDGNYDLNDEQRAEASVFAAMAMDKENRFAATEEEMSQ